MQITTKVQSSNKLSRLVLALIMVTYLVVAFLYAKSVPKWNAPDEPSHFNYAKTIAQTWTFPILKQGDYDFDYLEKAKAAKFPDSMSVDGIRYESHHPPLYYVLATPLLLLSSGLPVDAQVLILRLLTALFGALTIVVTFVIARRLFPDDQVLAPMAAAFVAFVPMHTFMNASINNDSLANLLLSILLLLLITRRSHKTVETKTKALIDRESLILGIVLGLCLLTKVTAYIGVVLVAFVIIVQQISNSRVKEAGIHWATVVRTSFWHLLRIYVVALLLSGWWFARNLIIYGNMDIFGLKRHDLVVVGQPLTGKFDLAAAKFFFLMSFKSFWGVFGWMGIFMDDRVYLVLAILTGAAILGLVLYVTYVLRHPFELSAHQKISISLLLLAMALIFGGWLQYNLTYIQAQGRYMFPTIAPIAIFFSLGLRQLISRRHAVTLFTLLFLGLAALDILSLYRFIIPQLR